MPKKTRLTLRYLVQNLSIVIGVVLVWRGLWQALDMLDKFAFGGSHLWTSIGGVLLGLLILYLPDRDLKELGKL